MSNGFLGLQSLMPVLQQAKPKCFLQMYFQYISYVDFALVAILLVFSYFVGTTLKYVSSVGLSFLLLKNFFGSHAQLAVDSLQNAAKNSFLESILSLFIKIVQNEIGAITFALIIGILLAKASSVCIIVGLLFSYISFYYHVITTNVQQTFLLNTLFFIGITIPVIVLFLLYNHFNTIFSAFSNATLSTFFLVWFLDKNCGIFLLPKSATESLVSAIANGKLLDLHLLIFMLFVALSMLSQILLLEPTTKTYYTVRGFKKY